MESFIHRQIPDNESFLFMIEAVDEFRVPPAGTLGRHFHPDKEMHEISGANHYYSGPDQRETLRKAIEHVTDWLVRHDFAKVD